jgi:hypothetical protein
VNLKNLTLSRIFYYQALRIVEHAVLPTALVISQRHFSFSVLLQFQINHFKTHISIFKRTGQLCKLSSQGMGKNFEGAI